MGVLIYYLQKKELGGGGEERAPGASALDPSMNYLTESREIFIFLCGKYFWNVEFVKL